MKSDFFVSDGARQHFIESGAGIPVIFLHPAPLDHFYWLPLIESLGGIHAVALDLRGHGASELGANLPIGGFARVPDAPMLTMAQLADDAIALLDQLGIQKGVFVGCSIGGYVLFELWRRVSQRMRGLAFICSKAQPDTEANLAKRAENIAKVRAGEREALFDGMAQSSTGATARTRRPAIVPELRARMTLTADAVVAVQAGLAARPDSLPTVATIAVPVFGVAGGEDGAVAAAEREALRAAPGGCQLHLLPDAGHFAAYEQPDAVASLLAPWLKQFGA